MTAVQPSPAQPIEHLYELHYLYLLRLATLLTGQRAIGEDLVQEAFLAVMQRSEVSELEEAAQIAYLRRCILNGARSTARRAKVAQMKLSSLLPLDVNPVDQQIILTDRDKSILSEVGRLPLRQRQVIVLRYWGDLSFIEIAKQLRISVGATTATASKAIRSLKLSTQDMEMK